MSKESRSISETVLRIIAKTTFTDLGSLYEKDRWGAIDSVHRTIIISRVEMACNIDVDESKDGDWISIGDFIKYVKDKAESSRFGSEVSQLR